MTVPNETPKTPETGTESSNKETQTTQQTNEAEGQHEEGKGSKDAVLADLAKERDRRQQLEAELESYKEAQKTETEKALDQARREGATEVETKYQGLLVKHAVVAAAAGKLNDPNDAAHFLSLDGIEVDDTGSLKDPAALQAKIAELIEQKPYLAANTEPPRPQGHAGAGARTDQKSSASVNDMIRSAMRK